MKLLRFYFKEVLIIIISITVVFSCSDEDENMQGKITVESVSAQNISSGGVVLKGDLRNSNSDLNLGFVLSTQENQTYDKIGKVIFKKGVSDGEHKVEIRNGLIEGKKYYFNCFVNIDGEEIFGTERVFISNGSALPVVSDYYPKQARLSDTIVISGAFFSSNPEVFFSGIKAVTLTESDSLIKVKVPYPESSYETVKPYKSIKIINNDKQEKELEDFSMLEPRIDSISPKYITDSDTLKIHGANFDRKSFDNMVTTNYNGVEYKYKILELKDNLIKVAPQKLHERNPTFIVRSQLTSVSRTVQVLLPKISAINKSCYSFEDELIIYGSNFPVNNQSSFTKINDRYIFASEKTKNKLVFNLGKYIKFKDFTGNEISMEYLGEEIFSADKLCIDEPWIMVNESYNHTYSSEPHYFEGDYYSITNSSSAHGISRKMGKFDVSEISIVEVEGSLPPDENYFNNSTLLGYHGSNFYIKHYVSSDVDGFFSYNIFTNEKIELANFPGEQRANGFMVTIGDYIYTGLGVRYPYTPKTDIWRYSISQNTWEKIIDDFPEISSYQTSKESPFFFVVKDKIYLGSGQPYGNYKLDLWEFDTQSYNITRKSNIPDGLMDYPLKLQQTFVLEDKVYFQYKSLYEYDPMLDTWRIIETNEESYFRASYFVVDNDVYMLHDGYIYKFNTKYLN